MFNGYHEPSLISYNEYDQEREKKQENVQKWSYGQDSGVQPALGHPNNRQAESWSGKSNFVGLSHVAKCNCSGCYSSSESQSYHGDSTRHRPWLPRTFPVPLNGSSESSKLPGYHQWDGVGHSNQSSCFPDGGVGPPSQYLQETAGKHAYYRHYQNRPEMNQPGVITSVKTSEFAKKQKEEMTVSSPGQESFFSCTNGTMPCNPGYNLTKRIGPNYCDLNEKYSNVASYSVDQQISRLPVVEPYIKAVPSINQNRVPSTGHRSIKENMPQPFVDPGYNRKICSDMNSVMNGDKKTRGLYQPMPKDALETFQTGPTTIDLKNMNYSHFNINRDYVNMEMDSQKLIETSRHHEYFSRNNLSEMIKRNNYTPILDNRRDCAMGQTNQVNLSEQHYGSRSSQMPKYLDPKPSCAVFYADKKFDYLQENPCAPQNSDIKSESMNVRVPRSSLIFNDSRFPDRGQSISYQNNPTPYRNYAKSEYSYQGYNLQGRFEYPHIPPSQCNPRNAALEAQNCGVDQLIPQGNNSFVFESYQQHTSDKNLSQKFFSGKNSSPNLMQTESLHHSEDRLEVRKPNPLEMIRCEEITKTGTSKISPLRLLRKKKFVTQNSEPIVEPVVRTTDTAPALDVRKFLSTWAEEEEDLVAPTQMVVLDCQNIDPEQAKLLQLYESDPLRGVHLESGSILTVREPGCIKEQPNLTVQTQESLQNEPKNDVTQPQDRPSSDVIPQAKDEIARLPSPVPEITEPVSQPVTVEIEQKMSPSKSCKRGKNQPPQDLNRCKRKSDEINRLDKWTEKKFDFLKRSEESKAAEILRHEEEKKKIFERRLSLQQGKVLRNSLENSEERKENSSMESMNENFPERLSPFDENSRSKSPDGSEGAPGLPTSEYRRNKFLDYSERQIIMNGTSCKEENERANSDDRLGDIEVKTNTLQAVEKKADIKLEFPTLKTAFPEGPKLKEEGGLQCMEMDDILKKMSEINFQSTDIKMENECHPKKERIVSHGKKGKKKKLEQENEEKLTVENISSSKPTIKFSIQKSHDLKISFKVLNSKKYENSDEDIRGKESELTRNSVEDSENSTELITLKYKSIQRESPNCDSGLKKNRRRFRRKKARETHEMKTPILKIKKSRYLPQEEERDPLADDADCLNLSKKPYSDEYSTSDDFQVHETVDSAKIKLTFKRHKGNFETEYKINNGVGKLGKDNLEDSGGPKDSGDDCSGKESRREAEKTFCEEGNSAEATPGVENGLDNVPKEVQSESEAEGGGGNSRSPEEPVKSPENLAPISFGSPSDLHVTPENECVAPVEGNVNLGERNEKPSDLIKLSCSEEDLNKSGQEQVELINDEPNCDKDIRPEIKSDDLTLNCNLETASADAGDGKDSLEDFEKEEIQEISLDFIRETEPPEIKTNYAAGKTENSEIPEETAFEMQNENLWNEETSCSTNEISHSDNIDSSYKSKSIETKDDDEKTSFPDPRLEIEENEEKEEKTECDLKDYERDQHTENPIGNRSLDFVEADKCLAQDNEKISSISMEVASPEQMENKTKPPDNIVDGNDEQPGLVLTETAIHTTEGIKEENLNQEPEEEGAKALTIDIQAPSISEMELEEGEIIDDDLEEEQVEETSKPKSWTKEFQTNKIQRRHSLSLLNSVKYLDKESCCRRRKSCPPGLKFLFENPSQTVALDIPVADIPLPPGEPPPENCFDFSKYFQSKATLLETKELEKTKADDAFQLDPPSGNHGSSPSLCKLPKSAEVNILQRSSKIKFSLTKRIKFQSIVSKLEIDDGNDAKEIQKPLIKLEEKSEKEEESAASKENPTPDDICREEDFEAKVEEINPVEERRKSPEQHQVELMEMGESENVEVIDVMSFDSGDFIRDEFYEYEDIPTSEDLPNGMEVEKVPDDDKFRNMMQNCLDNAKKFLNVGNLKLFSCSVDDLLELDCQMEETEPGKSTEEPMNHISRDVLLTSCEDATNDDLGLSEKFQPEEISMDFVPSFCSDVCPEILPVDNWPYLEEEVPSSPTKSKQDETDLIPESGSCSNHPENLDAIPSYPNNTSTKNGRSRSKPRRIFLPGIENGSFRRFRRRSLITDGEALRMCSKISMQRRRTIESFGANFLSYQKDCDFKSEISRFKNGIDKMENIWRNNNSLKCRLSLEKISKNEDKQKFKFAECPSSGAARGGDICLNKTPSKRKYLDYKSSTWQPKVMLFRISKNELKKMYRHSKVRRSSESSDYKKSSEIDIKIETCSKSSYRKQKSNDLLPCEKIKYVQPEPEDKHGVTVSKEEKDWTRLPQIDSIKGSLSTSSTSDIGKRKKSRFRNLHSKKKTEHVCKEVKPSAHCTSIPSPRKLVDKEFILDEISKEADIPKERVSNSQNKSTKESTSSVKNVDEKVKNLDSDRQVKNHKSISVNDKEKHSQNRSKEQSSKHRVHDEKKHDYKYRRRDGTHRENKEEGYLSDHKHKHKGREKELSRHGTHERSRHTERSPDCVKIHRKGEQKSNLSEEEKEKNKGDVSAEDLWVCQVCGFSDANERVSHIKNHPFHCQSCHLAFKTEVYFINHLKNKHKDIRNQHHCLLCELSFDTEDQYYRHLETREHKHLESVEKNTINTLFTLLTGQPCPVLGIVEMKPEWLPNQAGTVHFYHQATPLSLALQYLKMHHDLSSYSTVSSAHSN